MEQDRPLIQVLLGPRQVGKSTPDSQGKLPPNGKKLVEEWRKKNQKALSLAWAAAVNMKMPKKIRGLE